jgi:hypothetical protein
MQEYTGAKKTQEPLTYMLRCQRAKQGMTTLSAAETLKVDQTTVRRYEVLKRVVPYKDLAKFCTLYQIIQDDYVRLALEQSELIGQKALALANLQNNMRLDFAGGSRMQLKIPATVNDVRIRKGKSASLAIY